MTPASHRRPPTSRAGVHGGSIGAAAEPTHEELLGALESYTSRDAPLTAAEARDLLAAAIDAVAPLDGAEREPDTVGRCAWHEGSHALIARAHEASGRGPGPTLARIESAQSGATHFGDGPSDRDAQVEVLVAGAVGERLAFGAVLGAGPDLARAAELVAGAPDPRALVRSAVSRVEATLRLGWGELEALARGLLRAGALRADHLATLAEHAQPAARLDDLDHGAIARLLAASGDGEVALRALERAAERIDRGPR